MSRSYKKTPIIKSVHPLYKKFCKRHSNKKIRQMKDLSNYGSFKKLFQSCEIHGYICYYPKEKKPYWMSYNYWEKCYLRK